MEKWNTENYKQYLQKVQTGNATEPAKEILEKLCADFREIYDDFITEDADAREAKRAAFERAITVYFQLGHSLVLNLTINPIEAKNNPEPVEQVVEQRPTEEPQPEVLLIIEANQPEQAAEYWDQDGMDVEMPKLVPVSQRRQHDEQEPSTSDGAKKKANDQKLRKMTDQSVIDLEWDDTPVHPNLHKQQIQEIPYEQMVFILKPILSLMSFNVVTEEIIQEVITKIQLVHENARSRCYELGNETKMVIAIVESKLDSQTRAMWNWELADSPRQPTLDMFIDFLLKRQKRISPEERAQSAMAIANAGPSRIEEPNNCVYCSGPHKLCKCPRFRNLPIRSCWDILEQTQVCINCFSRAHMTGACEQGACRLCKSKHNSLMCPHSWFNKDNK